MRNSVSWQVFGYSVTPKLMFILQLGLLKKLIISTSYLEFGRSNTSKCTSLYILFCYIYKSAMINALSLSCHEDLTTTSYQLEIKFYDCSGVLFVFISYDLTLTYHSVWQRFSSQDRENSIKKNSFFPPLSYSREECQLPLSKSSTSLTQRWKSTPLPDSKCKFTLLDSAGRLISYHFLQPL